MCQKKLEGHNQKNPGAHFQIRSGTTDRNALDIRENFSHNISRTESHHFHVVT